MQTISVDELKSRMDAGEKINLVDVRESFENADFNIGGRLVPLGKIQSMQVDELDDLKDQEVILYCRSGNRSAKAALCLHRAGHAQAWNLVGGVALAMYSAPVYGNAQFPGT